MFYYGNIFEMSAKLEAQDNAWSSKFAEIDGKCLDSCSNDLIKFCVLLHWFTFKIALKRVFTLSKISLLIFPKSLFARLISRHFGLFSKFPLCL